MRNSLRLLPLLALPFGALAADTVNINVSGTLHNPITCNLTDPGSINFDDILSSRIEGIGGTAYKKDVNISVSCSSYTGPQTVDVTVTTSCSSGCANRIGITGVAKGFDLALKRSGVPLNLGAKIPITANGPLNLSLTPQKNNDAFVPGAFTATATVKVNVQ
ncbi:hypothetical protein SME22J_08820 [Serratia marcescens]|nr:hypothetical protein SME22J_08820 [Serratia marcescens]